MANPFSGLENIGQSYLQGVQLANQRQYREEAAAQRAEDTRVRGQYYQDLVDQRREAATLTAQNRADVLGSKFAEHLTLNPDGSVNLVESSRKLKEAEGQDAFNETAGLAESLGAPIGEVDKKIRGTKAFQKGLALGIVKKMENETAYNRVLASQGIIPGGDSRAVPIPPDLESTISGAPRENTFGLMGGGSEPIMNTLDVLGEGITQDNVPQMMAQAPARTAPAETIPEGYTRGVINGKNVLVRKPKAEKAEKTDYPGKIKIETPEGEMELRLTAEQIAERLAKARVSAGTNNAAVKARFQRDPVTGKLVLAK